MGGYVKFFIKLALIFNNLHCKICQNIYEIILRFVKSVSEIVFYSLTLEQVH